MKRKSILGKKVGLIKDERCTHNSLEKTGAQRKIEKGQFSALKKRETVTLSEEISQKEVYELKLELPSLGKEIISFAKLWCTVTKLRIHFGKSFIAAPMHPYLFLKSNITQLKHQK